MSASRCFVNIIPQEIYKICRNTRCGEIICRIDPIYGGAFLLTFTSFLFRQERCPKEADSRGVESRAPARQSHPLRIPRRALTTPLEHLNLQPVPNKNVPIFVRQFGSVRRGIPKGAHLLEAPLRPLSLVTFLCGHKKVTPTFVVIRNGFLTYYELTQLYIGSILHIISPHLVFRQIL